MQTSHGFAPFDGHEICQSSDEGKPRLNLCETEQVLFIATLVVLYVDLMDEVKLQLELSIEHASWSLDLTLRIKASHIE